MAIYQNIYNGPPRWYTKTRTNKKYIMIHATANDASAEAEANYAKHRDDRVSSHYYVDDDSIVQSLDTDYRAWHAGNTEGNDHAIAYELTARNMNVGRAWWKDLDNIEWPLMVAAIARDCREHGITPRNLTVAQLRAGNVTGFCMHYEGNEAWGGSTHTDPGPNFPMNHLVNQVQRALEDDMPLTQDDVMTIWRTDNVIRAPGDPESGNQFWTAESYLQSIRYHARRAGMETVKVRGMVAKLTGEDVEAEVRTAIREEFTELTEAAVTAVRAAVPEANQATVEAALRAVLGSLNENE